MMTGPEITLLIPCYNAGKYLPELHQNLQQMSVKFNHIICYDDGSTDDTVAVANHLGWQILSPNSNRGVSFARNRLAEAATTTWIHFHDADDRIALNYLEKTRSWATENCDVISCDADWISREGETLEIAWRYDADALVNSPAKHLLTNPMGLNSSLIRRSAWNGVGGCDESLSMWEDADVHFRLGLAHARWHHLPEILTWSLRDQTSFSHDYKKNWNCRLQALTKYAQSHAETLGCLIAKEAETVAHQLHGLGDRDGAIKALGLAKKLGRKTPSTNNPLLKLFRIFIPSILALDLQHRFRGKKS